MCLVQNNLHWVMLVYLYIILLFLHDAILSKQGVLSQYWDNVISIIGSISVAGQLPICCTKIISLLGADMKPMLQLPMETNNGPITASHIPMPRLPTMGNHYWANIGLHAVWALRFYPIFKGSRGLLFKQTIFFLINGIHL